MKLDTWTPKCKTKGQGPEVHPSRGIRYISVGGRLLGATTGGEFPMGGLYVKRI